MQEMLLFSGRGVLMWQPSFLLIRGLVLLENLNTHYFVQWATAK